MIHGYVETILGRKRFIFSDPKQKTLDNATRRMLLNYPIQGSAADLMKLAMVKVYKNIVQKDPEIKLLLQIHDDLVFEMPNNNIAKIKETIHKIRETLCTVYPLIVPMAVDVKTGDKWGEMKVFAEGNA
jgi:DNA polymerase-1